MPPRPTPESSPTKKPKSRDRSGSGGGGSAAKRRLETRLEAVATQAEFLNESKRRLLERFTASRDLAQRLEKFAEGRERKRARGG